MKMSGKYLLIVMSIVLILSFLVGCSAKSSMDKAESQSSAAGRPPTATPAPAPAPTAPEEAAEDMDMGFPGSGFTGIEPEKIITTVYLTFETTDFQTTNDNLNNLIEKYKAYTENSNISYSNYYNSKMYRSGDYVIRVPRENVTSFKTELNLIGNLTNENSNKQDVTKHYTDTESRLKVITTKEERILALLEKAEKIEDIIQLENQLSQIIYEKESLKSTLLTLDDKIDYSTVHISIREVEKLTNSETVETTFGTRILNAINDSIFFFKNALQGFVISIIYILPFAVVFGLVIYILYRVIKKIRIRIKRD